MSLESEPKKIKIGSQQRIFFAQNPAIFLQRLKVAALCRKLFFLEAGSGFLQQGVEVVGGRGAVAVVVSWRRYVVWKKPGGTVLKFLAGKNLGSWQMGLWAPRDVFTIPHTDTMFAHGWHDLLFHIEMLESALSTFESIFFIPPHAWEEKNIWLLDTEIKGPFLAGKTGSSEALR